MTPQQIEAMNIAGQCRATASSPLAKNILVDEGNGLLTELLLDAARIIEALAQPEQIQPSAYSNTHQPERTWVGLTDEEIQKEFHPLHATGLQFARAIEAKLKEKNT